MEKMIFRNLLVWLVMMTMTCNLYGQDIIENEELRKLKTADADHIIYVDLLSFFLYEELGLIYSKKNELIDYQFYFNYVYGGGLLNETPFHNASVRKWTYTDETPNPGFELGTQFRVPLKRNWEMQPYSDFIRDHSRTYYYGVWGEIAYRKGGVQYNYNYESIKSSSATVGVITGWTQVKNNFAFDFYTGIGIGRVQAKLKIMDEEIYDQKRGFLFVFKAGMRFGVKL